MTYGFIGLGHQGTPMAERMIATGLKPWLWARRAEVLAKYTGERLATSPAELAAHCDVIGLCLLDAPAIEQVVFGAEGVLASVRPGTVLAVHSTVGPAYLREFAARVAPAGVTVVDAPVSGGPAAAEGRLLVIAGGTGEAVDRCAEMFAAYSHRVVRTGDLGTAQAAKLVNNALMCAITGLVFDAFDLGAALHIDAGALADILASGSAANPSVDIYRTLGPQLFSVNAWGLLTKDVTLTRQLGVPTRRLIDVATDTLDEMAERRDFHARP